VLIFSLFDSHTDSESPPYETHRFRFPIETSICDRVLYPTSRGLKKIITRSRAMPKSDWRARLLPDSSIFEYSSCPYKYITRHGIAGLHLYSRSRAQSSQRDPRPHGRLAKRSSCSLPLTVGYDSLTWPPQGKRLDRSIFRPSANMYMLRQLTGASIPAVIPEILVQVPLEVIPERRGMWVVTDTIPLTYLPWRLSRTSVT
jgi:hypothetical protein